MASTPSYEIQPFGPLARTIVRNMLSSMLQLCIFASRRNAIEQLAMSSSRMVSSPNGDAECLPFPTHPQYTRALGAIFFGSMPPSDSGSIVSVCTGR